MIEEWIFEIQCIRVQSNLVILTTKIRGQPVGKTAYMQSPSDLMGPDRLSSDNEVTVLHAVGCTGVISVFN